MLDLLLVDDEPAIRLAMGDWLAQAGHRVWRAADGREGLARLRERRFDVVVTDVRMPHMTGIELLSRVKLESPDTDVIMVTAHAEVSDAVVALKQGAYDYLIKPFDPEELILRVHRLEERRGLRRDLASARAAASGQLGPYRLEHRIASGSMGDVYHASHAMLRRPTAVKLLRPSRADEHSIARFEREVQLTCRLTHPNTIAIYDYGRTPDGVFYYAMELLNGATLDRIVRATGPMPDERVVHVLEQICGSLHEAHRAGLIHRDVKPSNVQLCERGGVCDTVKVLDFGLVRGVGTLPQDERGVVAGTPAYMAPELFRDPAAASVASDVYALGALAYTLLAGAPPAVARRRAGQVPGAPGRAAQRGVDAALESLVMACLSASPADRPASMDAVRSRLRGSPLYGRWDEGLAQAWWRRYAERVQQAPALDGRSRTTELALGGGDSCAAPVPALRDQRPGGGYAS